MRIRHSRRAAVIVAGCALAVSPVASTGVLPAQAADGSFSPVATLPTGTYDTFGDLVSPVEGEAYVTGEDADGTLWVKRWADGRLQDVTVPAAPVPERKLDLATNGERTYLLQRSRTSQAKGTVHELTGTTSTPIALPDTIPGTTTDYFTQAVTADRTGLWVVVGTASEDGYYTGRQQLALHWDGTTWTATPSTDYGTRHGTDRPSAESMDGVLYRFASTDRDIERNFFQHERGARWDGKQVVEVPRRSWLGGTGTTVFYPGWTFTYPMNYTMWGYEAPKFATPDVPSITPKCVHVIDTRETPCPVPAGLWQITAAARLADGRVLLGRTHELGSKPDEESFNLVDHDGATPVHYGGESGRGTVALAAAPAGRTVLAVTRKEVNNVMTYTLQSTTLAPKVVEPKPTPTPQPLPYDVIVNGGFEGGQRPWVGTAGPITTNPGRPARTGTGKMWLGGNGSRTVESEEQRFAVPTWGTFSYHLAIDTAERTTTTKYDTLTVTVDGTPVGTYSNLDRSSGYVRRTADLSRWAGKVVTLAFTAREDGADQTSFVVDDVEIR